MEVFAARLKWTRNKKAFTQAVMAEKVEMSQPGYGKLENGQRQPNLETLVRISNVLDESVDYLLGITDFDKHMSKTYDSLLECSKLINDVYHFTAQITKSIIETTSRGDDPSYLQMQIDLNNRNLAEYKKLGNELRNELLNHLNEVPFSGEKTIEKVKNIPLD